MKKCIKCELVFQLEERTRCLYCNTLLIELDPEEEPADFEVFEEGPGDSILAKKKLIITQMINDRRVKGHGRMQYIIGSYFRTRTFQFMYGFSRNDFLIGKDFPRTLIQPLNASHFFILPWIVIDLIDSVLVRLIYTGYCPSCGWKYNRLLNGAQHNPRKCRYCHEYSLVIEDILTGRITQTERIFKKKGFEAHAAKERSAYFDLCSQNKLMPKILDIMCIWFSVTIMLSMIVMLLWPLFRFLIGGLELTPLDLR